MDGEQREEGLKRDQGGGNKEKMVKRLERGKRFGKI